MPCRRRHGLLEWSELLDMDDDPWPCEPDPEDKKWDSLYLYHWESFLAIFVFPSQKNNIV
jgi:hypothetical protein